MSDLKKKLNRENEAKKRAALKKAGLQKVVVFVYPNEVEGIKKFDRSKEIWDKPRGRKSQNDI